MIIRLFKIQFAQNPWFSLLSSRIKPLHLQLVLYLEFVCLPQKTFCKIDTISYMTFNLSESTLNIILCGPYGEISRIAFQGVESDFVHLRSSLLSPISFWCTHEVPMSIEDWISVVENHIFLLSFHFRILLAYTLFLPYKNKIYYFTKK